MDYRNTLNLDVMGLNSKVNKEPGKPMTSSEHSELAMRAAKQMRRTRHKVKTGHKVCHHLLQMINESVDQPAPRTARRYHGLKHSLSKHSVSGDTLGGAVTRTENLNLSPANDRQFSLAF